jgi:hypothetical protein
MEWLRSLPLESPPHVSGPPPLAPRGPAVPATPLKLTTLVPRAAPALTPGVPTRSTRPHRTLGDRLAPREVFIDPPAPGPQDPPVWPVVAFGKVYERQRRWVTQSAASTSSLATTSSSSAAAALSIQQLSPIPRLFGTLLLIRTGAAPWGKSTAPCCPITLGNWYSSHPTTTSSPGSGFSGTSSTLMGPWSDTKPVGSFAGLLGSPGSTTMRLLDQWSSQLRSGQSSPWHSLAAGLSTNSM